MLLEGLVGVVAAPHGRYIALSTYERDEWRIYVSFDDISRRRPRWWGRALTKKDLEVGGTVAYPSLSKPPTLRGRPIFVMHGMAEVFK